MSDIASIGAATKPGTALAPGLKPWIDPPLIPSPMPALPRERTIFDESKATGFFPSFDIDGGAQRALEVYDGDDDGSISVKRDKSMWAPDATRLVNGQAKSLERLVNDADELGNRDGTTTAEEMADVIRRFDANGDGRLAGNERDAFLLAYGERDDNFWMHHKPGDLVPIDQSQTVTLPPMIQPPNAGVVKDPVNIGLLVHEAAHAATNK